jgi:hypothetical protein
LNFQRGSLGRRLGRRFGSRTRRECSEISGAALSDWQRDGLGPLATLQLMRTLGLNIKGRPVFARYLHGTCTGTRFGWLAGPPVGLRTIIYLVLCVERVTGIEPA